MPKEFTWKTRLAEMLKEHEDVDVKFTGKIEINMNDGGITKVYAYKELK